MSLIMWLVPLTYLLTLVLLCFKGIMTGFHLEESVTRQSEPTMWQRLITAVQLLMLHSRHPVGSHWSLCTHGFVTFSLRVFSNHRSRFVMYRTSLKGQEVNFLKRRPQLMSVESWYINSQSTSLSGRTILKQIIDGFPEALWWVRLQLTTW